MFVQTNILVYTDDIICFGKDGDCDTIIHWLNKNSEVKKKLIGPICHKQKEIWDARAFWNENAKEVKTPMKVAYLKNDSSQDPIVK